MIKKDLTGIIITSKMAREQEIFKYAKPFMGVPTEPGYGYMKKGAEFHVGEEAKRILIGHLIKGWVKEDFKDNLEFLDKKNKVLMSIGFTIVAFGLQTQQREVMKDVDNAEQIISDWVDFMMEYKGY